MEESPVELLFSVSWPVTRRLAGGDDTERRQNVCGFLLPSSSAGAVFISLHCSLLPSLIHTHTPVSSHQEMLLRIALICRPPVANHAHIDFLIYLVPTARDLSQTPEDGAESDQRMEDTAGPPQSKARGPIGPLSWAVSSREPPSRLANKTAGRKEKQKKKRARSAGRSTRYMRAGRFRARLEMFWEITGGCRGAGGPGTQVGEPEMRSRFWVSGPSSRNLPGRECGEVERKDRKKEERQRDREGKRGGGYLSQVTRCAR